MALGEGMRCCVWTSRLRVYVSVSRLCWRWKVICVQLTFNTPSPTSSQPCGRGWETQHFIFIRNIEDVSIKYCFV